MELMMSKAARLLRIRAGSHVFSCIVGLLLAAAMLVGGGCAHGPQFIAQNRPLVDRKLVEYPPGFELSVAMRGLTAPSAVAFVTAEGEYNNAILIAESGNEGSPRIYGYKPDGTYFSIYPAAGRIPTFGLISRANDIYAPIGGMCVVGDRIFVTHRDSRGRGVVTSFGFDGSSRTVVSDLPAEGDYSVTDIAESLDGRLYFGVGAATNSGVVGIDNWQVGWVRKHPNFCDVPASLSTPSTLKLLGFKFLTKNPTAGLFGGDDNVETGPFQPFGKNNQLRIPKSDTPTAAIYSVSPTGGDLRQEAWGLRLPRGITFDEWGAAFMTNDGMELRGTRPVKDDPDVLLKLQYRTWYGWPDFSADLSPISEPRFLEPALIMRTGYPELTFLIDHATSGLVPPTQFRDVLLQGIFPSLSGAAKLDFVPPNTPFQRFQGSVIVALSGDRAPFATSGQKLRQPVGYKVVRVDTYTKEVHEFIHNTRDLPASKLGISGDALERPVDVKFGPDGNLYILDYGKMEMHGGHEKITRGTGKLLILRPTTAPAQ
jgi:glucose/arabinose dehydrogenase